MKRKTKTLTFERSMSMDQIYERQLNYEARQVTIRFGIIAAGLWG